MYINCLKMNRFVRLYLLVLFASFGTASFAQYNYITADLLWKMGRLSMEDVSKDGKKILYTLTKYDIEANTGSSDIYILDAESKAAVRLTVEEGAKYNVRFTTDGKRIGYLMKGFLYEISLDGSDKKQLTTESWNGFTYDPADRTIGYIKDVKYDKTTRDLYPDLPKANVRIINDLMYRHWNQWEDENYSNLFYTFYSKGKVLGEFTNLINKPYDVPLQPNGDMEQIAYSPDGTQIAYTCKKLSGKEYATSTNSDVYIYSFKTGKTVNISEGMNGYDMNPVWSPDGKKIAWQSMKTPGFEADRKRLMVHNFETNNNEEWTVGFDNEVDGAVWSQDGKTIWFIGGDKGTHQIYAMDAVSASHPIRKVTNGKYDYQSVIERNGIVYATRMSMSQPTDIYTINPMDGYAKQLTKVNDDIIGNLKMGEVTERWVTTTDGKKMLVWVILPPDFDKNKKYPALLYCQGGPQSAVSQFWSYRWNFQLMAAQGYVVIAPCRRGMPTFGQAWNDQISGDWGGQCMRDYISAVDNVNKEKYVDSTRMGAVGASFGGYSVYWLAGNYPDKFKALIAHCGMFNMESWYGTTEEMWFANYDLGGPYWDHKNADNYKNFSPHKYAKYWKAPILIFHGEKDFRVPVEQGMEAFQAAQLMGVPSKLVLFPGEGHWVLSPQNALLWQSEFFGWLNKYLKK